MNFFHKLKKAKDSSNFMILFMSSSSLISNILTIISGLLVARWILPEVMGEFNSFTIFSSYIILAQIGIPIALGRELPLNMGKGDVMAAQKFAKAAQFYALVLSSIIIIVSLIVSIYFIALGEFKTSAGVFVVALLSLEGFYVNQYLKILYRGTNDFNKLSIINLFQSVVSFFAIYFVYEWGFYGLCLRALLSFLAVLSLAWYWRPTKVKPSFEKESFVHLLKLGFPMFLVNNIYSLWPVLQKTVILALGGTLSLGLYTIATVVQGSLNTVSQSIGSVTYATMANQWGSGKNMNQLFKLALRPVLMAAGLFAICIPIGWFTMPYFVKLLMPNYLDGVKAGQWMLITGFIGLFNVWTHIYNVANHQKEKLYSFLFGLTGWLITLGILYKLNGFGLEIFPQSVAVGLLLILIYNLIYIRKNKYLTYK